MKYRVKETQITDTYSEFSIERKLLWFWITVTVDERYLCSGPEAQRWVNLKLQGYPVSKYYYERNS